MSRSGPKNEATPKGTVEHDIENQQESNPATKVKQKRSLTKKVGTAFKKRPEAIGGVIGLAAGAIIKNDSVKAFVKSVSTPIKDALNPKTKDPSSKEMEASSPPPPPSSAVRPAVPPPNKPQEVLNKEKTSLDIELAAILSNFEKNFPMLSDDSLQQVHQTQQPKEPQPTFTFTATVTKPPVDIEVTPITPSYVETTHDNHASNQQGWNAAKKNHEETSKPEQTVNESERHSHKGLK